MTEYMIMAAVHGWTGYREATDVGPSARLIQLEHSSLSKKLKELDYSFIKAVFERIVQRLNRAGQWKMKLPNRLLLARNRHAGQSGRNNRPQARRPYWRTAG
ncbi:hypothetical protein [Domibacillus antri]|uniref:hypothetical protein n=1 Tax=Domibacillus antri TaxID=1714264 RepID=UPI003CCBBF95